MENGFQKMILEKNWEMALSRLQSWSNQRQSTSSWISEDSTKVQCMPSWLGSLDASIYRAYQNNCKDGTDYSSCQSTERAVFRIVEKVEPFLKSYQKALTKAPKDILAIHQKYSAPALTPENSTFGLVHFDQNISSDYFFDVASLNFNAYAASFIYRKEIYIEESNLGEIFAFNSRRNIWDSISPEISRNLLEIQGKPSRIRAQKELVTSEEVKLMNQYSSRSVEPSAATAREIMKDTSMIEMDRMWLDLLNLWVTYEGGYLDGSQIRLANGNLFLTELENRYSDVCGDCQQVVRNGFSQYENILTWLKSRAVEFQKSKVFYLPGKPVESQDQNQAAIDDFNIRLSEFQPLCAAVGTRINEKINAEMLDYERGLPPVQCVTDGCTQEYEDRKTQIATERERRIQSALQNPNQYLPVSVIKNYKQKFESLQSTYIADLMSQGEFREVGSFANVHQNCAKYGSTLFSTNKLLGEFNQSELSLLMSKTNELKKTIVLHQRSGSDTTINIENWMEKMVTFYPTAVMQYMIDNPSDQHALYLSYYIREKLTDESRKQMLRMLPKVILSELAFVLFPGSSAAASPPVFYALLGGTGITNMMMILDEHHDMKKTKNAIQHALARRSYGDMAFQMLSEFEKNRAQLHEHRAQFIQEGVFTAASLVLTKMMTFKMQKSGKLAPEGTLGTDLSKNKNNWTLPEKVQPQTGNSTLREVNLKPAPEVPGTNPVVGKNTIIENANVIDPSKTTTKTIAQDLPDDLRFGNTPKDISNPNTGVNFLPPPPAKLPPSITGGTPPVTNSASVYDPALAALYAQLKPAPDSPSSWESAPIKEFNDNALVLLENILGKDSLTAQDEKNICELLRERAEFGLRKDVSKKLDKVVNAFLGKFECNYGPLVGDADGFTVSIDEFGNPTWYPKTSEEKGKQGRPKKEKKKPPTQTNDPSQSMDGNWIYKTPPQNPYKTDEGSGNDNGGGLHSPIANMDPDDQRMFNLYWEKVFAWLETINRSKDLTESDRQEICKYLKYHKEHPGVLNNDIVKQLIDIEYRFKDQLKCDEIDNAKIDSQKHDPIQFSSFTDKTSSFYTESQGGSPEDQNNQSAPNKKTGNHPKDFPDYTWNSTSRPDTEHGGLIMPIASGQDAALAAVINNLQYPVGDGVNAQEQQKQNQRLETIKRDLMNPTTDPESLAHEICEMLRRGNSSAFAISQRFGIDCNQYHAPTSQNSTQYGKRNITNASGGAASTRIRNMGGVLNDQEEFILQSIRDSNLSMDNVTSMQISDDFFSLRARKIQTRNGQTYYVLISDGTELSYTDGDLQRMYASYEINKKLINDYPTTLFVTIGGKKAIVVQGIKNEARFSIHIGSKDFANLTLKQMWSEIKKQASIEVGKQTTQAVSSPAYQQLTTNNAFNRYRLPSEIFLFDVLTGFLDRDIYKNTIMTTKHESDIQLDLEDWPFDAEDWHDQTLIFNAKHNFSFSVENFIERDTSWQNYLLRKYFSNMNINPMSIIKQIIYENSAFIQKLRQWSEAEIRYDLEKYLSEASLQLLLQNRTTLLSMADQYAVETNGASTNIEQIGRFLDELQVDIPGIQEKLNHYSSLINNSDLVKAKNTFFAKAATSTDKQHIARNLLYALDELDKFNHAHPDKIIQQQKYIEQIFKSNSDDIFSPRDMSAYKINIQHFKYLIPLTVLETQEVRELLSKKYRFPFKEDETRDNVLNFEFQYIMLIKELNGLDVNGHSSLVNYRFTPDWTDMKKSVSGEIWLPVTDEFGHKDLIFFTHPKYTAEGAKTYFSHVFHSEAFGWLKAIVDSIAQEIYKNNPLNSLAETQEFLWKNLYFAHDLKSLGSITFMWSYNREIVNEQMNSKLAFFNVLSNYMSSLGRENRQRIVTMLEFQLERVGFFETQSNERLNEALLEFIQHPEHSGAHKDTVMHGFYERQIELFTKKLDLNQNDSQKLLEIIQNMKHKDPDKLYHFLRTISFELNTPNYQYILNTFMKTEGRVIETPTMAADTRELHNIYDAKRNSFADAQELYDMITLRLSLTVEDIFESFQLNDDAMYFGAQIEKSDLNEYTLWLKTLHPYPRTYIVHLSDAKNFHGKYLMPGKDEESGQEAFFEFDPETQTLQKINIPKLEYFDSFSAPLYLTSMRTVAAVQNIFAEIPNIEEAIKQMKVTYRITDAVQSFDYNYFDIELSRYGPSQRKRITIVNHSVPVPGDMMTNWNLATYSWLRIYDHFVDKEGTEFIFAYDITPYMHIERN